jgi:hypothetical protein
VDTWERVAVVLVGLATLAVLALYVYMAIKQPRRRR